MVLFIATLLAGAWAWHDPLPIRHLAINTQQHATLHYRGQTHAATLCSGSLKSLYLCCLIWQLSDEHNTRVYQWVFPDSTETENFRRLRVWMKFGQKT